jgi:hypothetical protein
MSGRQVVGLLVLIFAAIGVLSLAEHAGLLR